MLTERKTRITAPKDKILRGRPSLSSANARLAEKTRESVARVRESFESLLRAQQITPGGLDVAALIQRELAQIQSALDSFAKSSALALRAPIKRAVDLSTVANEAMLVVASSAPKGASFDLRRSDGALPAFADPVQISQVISTLSLHLLNADAGRIEISTGRKPGANGQTSIFIEIKSEEPGRATGRGDWLLHPRALLNHDEFAAALAVARRIVDLHGGDLKLESPRPDSGHGVRIMIALAELHEYHI